MVTLIFLIIYYHGHISLVRRFRALKVEVEV